jgi:hypothetical protein
VVAHLRKQGCPANDENGDCVYRGLNGTKCAAGCLIPDNRYSYSLEGNFVSDWPLGELEGGELSVAKLFEELGHDRGLVNELQQCHDRWDEHDNDALELKLQKVADKFELSYTPPEPVPA